MQIYGAGQVHGPQTIGAPHSNRIGQAGDVARYSAPSDELNLSSVGQVMDRIGDLPDIRADRVAQLRAAISQGDYDTDEKISLALDRFMLDEVA